MKRVIAVCTMLLAVCAMAWAGVTPDKPMTVQEKVQQANLAKADLDYVLEAKAAGTLDVNDPAYLRVVERMAAEGPGGNLDQGSNGCPALNITVPFTDTGTTCGNVNVINGCASWGAPQALYAFTAQYDAAITVSLCGSGYDTEIQVRMSGECPGTSLVVCNDDYCGLQSQVTFMPTVGTQYFVVVSGYSTSCGSYTLNIMQDTPLLGRCCYGDPSAPSCMVNLSNECAAIGGVWAANFTCDAPCPIVQCADFELAAPGQVSGNLVGAGNDCNLRGTDDQMVAVTIPSDGFWTFDLCASSESWDTYLYLSQSCCGAALYSNDDSQCPNWGWTGLSTISNIFLTAGVYYVDVEAYGTWYYGPWTLTVTSPPPPTGRCCYGDPFAPSCAMNTAAECDAIGGVWDQYATCESAPCQPLGRCCYSDPFAPYCATVTSDVCIWNYGGTWTAGVTCETAPCEAFICDADDPIDGRHCNPDDAYIYDYTATPIVIQVPVQYHITDLNASWFGYHTFCGDVGIVLTSPQGTEVLLVGNRGGGSDNWLCTTMDDEATTPVSAGSGPFTGSWIPDNALSAFDGENAYGDWTLTFYDVAGGDVGWIDWACLTFTWDEILAVELADFDAIAGDSRVTVAWSTAAETDNDHFEIVRDGQTVASVAGTNNPSGATYSWTDEGLTNGRTYRYTLVAVDANGIRDEKATMEATPNFNAGAVTEYALYQNYPNPFNPTTEIGFDLVAAGHVTLKVYNLMGQEVATVLNSDLGAGRHVVSFDAGDLPTGAYLYRIEANGYSAVKKMLLMK